MGSAEDIRALIEPSLASSGLELWDVETGRGLVRVLVDTPSGIDLDTLSEVNRIVSPLLDEHPEVTPAGSYQLEISSPGVERPLRTVDHFRRYIGSQITVKTAELVGGTRRHKGLLRSAGDDSIEIEPAEPSVGEADGSSLRIRHDQIERARTVLVWGPTPAPAARRRAARSPANASAQSAAANAKDAGL